MDNYNKKTDRILKYLEDNHFSSKLILAARACYDSLGKYISTENIPYSPQTAESWYESIKDELDQEQSDFYHSAIIRLRDDHEPSEDMDEPPRIAIYALNACFRDSLEEYLNSRGKSCTGPGHPTYSSYLARFLLFIQNSGINRISEITYPVLLNFYERYPYSDNQPIFNINGMLQYFYEKGELPYGFTVLYHFILEGSGCFWNEVPESVHDEIRYRMKTEETFPISRVVFCKEACRKVHEANGYSKGIRDTYDRAADLLILFLEMNGYQYNPEIAMAWFNGSFYRFHSQERHARRGLCLIAQYHECEEIRLDSCFRRKPCAFDRIPEWCREGAVSYVDMKIQEGWERSTMDMIRSSIARFCNYLDEAGLRSFKDLTREQILKFQAEDLHRTAAGKNAAHSRIRRFLMYLGEKGYLSNPMLFTSLSCEHAPKETIVVVLTDEEMNQLNDALNSPDSQLSLRKKAMLLLGLKMGMRSTDIVNLKYDDIHWDTASIRFTQKKTSVEVELPMPAEVGNALFRYIMDERGVNASPDIFLSESAPHKSLDRSACSRAMKTALPDRHVEGSGFHVTRKTFATDLLRGGTGAATVAEALGQRGTASVNRYLSLDEERMRMCALDGFEILRNRGVVTWRVTMFEKVL